MDPAASTSQDELRGPTAPEDRVPLRTKISYGAGGSVDMWGHWLYPNLAYPVFNIFLGLSPQLVGLALMLIRIVDAISDPFFGWLSDNTRTRFGRRRPFILVGGVLAGVGYAGAHLYLNHQFSIIEFGTGMGLLNAGSGGATLLKDTGVSKAVAAVGDTGGAA